MAAQVVPPGVKVLSVGELTRTVKGLLESAYPKGIWVSGEVSNLARPASGHLYFSLKDADSQLRMVMWAGVARRLRFDLRDGMEVIARGILTVYVPRGDYQVQVEELLPKGIGPLELAFQQLKEKLFGLGYFDRNRKKPLPNYPRRIALVTSPTGAAVRDMLETLGRRWPAVEVLVCPVKVQGEDSAQQIATGIRLVNRVPDVDVMIVGRGGGSLEDLWAFNEEVVARAIYESEIPVVSGIGHETDVTIADLVADCRALTPTDAATRVTPNATELWNGLLNLDVRLRKALFGRLELAKRHLDDLATRRAFRLPLARIHDLDQRLDDWGDRLRRAVKQRQTLAKERLESAAGRLESLSPLNVLSRGYSLTRKETDRAVVRNAEQVCPGERLTTVVQHGEIVSRVEEIRPAVSRSDKDGPAQRGCS